MKKNLLINIDDVSGIKADKESHAKEIWRRLRKNKTAMAGMLILGIFVLVALFADVIAPYETAVAQDSSMRLQPPSAEHFFGTDRLGRDMFARVVQGARVSLSIGLFTSLGSLIIAVIFGSLAGYYGGKTETLILRIVDVFMCIPSILLSLAVVAALGPNMINLLIAMMISAVPGKIRLIHSVILSVGDQEYVDAARVYGCSDARIIFKYILPNALGVIIVDTTMGIAGTILGAASLSFIGMGIQPPAPEWGSMLSEASEFLRRAPYLLVFPGVSILLSAMSCNLLGDGIRDAFDPKLKD
ncbi:MAG: ABC transporter permease [Anaerovoracaceae bacterium]